MAEVTKPIVPEPTVQTQPSPQQTAATLAPIAAQPAPAAPIAAQGAAAESSWFDDAGKTALAIGGFVGDRLKAGLEAGMDESRVLRLVGGLLGAESPSMRRAAMQEDLLRQNLELGQLRLAEAKAESIRNANADQWNRKVQERTEEIWRRQDRDDARKNAVDETTANSAIFQPFNATATQQVMTEAWDEYSALANRETDTVMRTTNQFTPDPQVFEAMRGTRVVQEAITTRAVLAMLDSKNPIVRQSAVATAKQYGIELSQREGKWFMKLPGEDGGEEGFELTERNRKWITAQLVGEIVTEAQARTRMKQWEQHAVSNGFLVAANRLRNEAGVGDAKEQEEKIAAIARAIPQADLELYGALNTLKQLYDGGLKKEEIPVMDYQLEQLAAKFGIEHNGGDGGVFLIEGKNPVKYAEERLRQNPFTLALNREIQTRKAEGVRRLAQLSAEAAAKKGAGMGGEGGEEPTAEDIERQFYASQGEELLKSNGMTDYARRIVYQHNLDEKDPEKHITEGGVLAVLGRAKDTFETAIANGSGAEKAYSRVVDCFEQHGLSESDIPDFFREARDRIELEAEMAKRPAILKRVAEAKKKYPAGLNAAKQEIASSNSPLIGYLVPEASELIDANAAWNAHVDRIEELSQRRKNRREAKELAEAAEAKRKEAEKLLTGGRGEKPKPKGKPNPKQKAKK